MIELLVYHIDNLKINKIKASIDDLEEIIKTNLDTN